LAVRKEELTFLKVVPNLPHLTIHETMKAGSRGESVDI